ncbi:MAG: gliding motility-associated lipoprotein GldH [Flavobacteriaceae bacterium]|jgi:gliding motility-associated lipoprotein GldH
MKLLRNSLFLALGLLLFSCGEVPLFEEVYSFEEREWGQDVKPSYEVEIDDIDKSYDFTLSLRTSTDYAYSNLWVFMKTITPDGATAREPFEIQVTNDDGSWVGEKSGSVVTTKLYFKERKLPMKGKYKFIIEQGITQSKIGDVHDLTFQVDEAKKEGK